MELRIPAFDLGKAVDTFDGRIEMLGDGASPSGIANPSRIECLSAIAPPVRPGLTIEGLAFNCVEINATSGCPLIVRTG